MRDLHEDLARAEARIHVLKKELKAAHRLADKWKRMALEKFDADEKAMREARHARERAERLRDSVD